jgi:hypothetical protein
MQYILPALVCLEEENSFGGISHSFSHVQKGSNHLREGDYYLICGEKLVKGFSCIVTRVLLSKR